MGNAGAKQEIEIPPGAKYFLRVKTGKVVGGTEGKKLTIRLFDGRGGSTKNISVPVPWTNQYEDGCENNIFLSDDETELGRLVRIDLTREKWAPADRWYVYWIHVYYVQSPDEEPSIFPVHRFINNKHVWILYEIDCSLPQNDQRHEQRSREIMMKRRRTDYVCRGNGVPAQADSVPHWDPYTSDGRCDTAGRRSTLIDLCDLALINKAPFVQMEDLMRLYLAPHLPVPACVRTWQSDDHFGQMRLTGVNPTAIRLCKEIPDGMKLDGVQVKPFLEGYTLQQCMRNDRIYMVDYREFDVVRYPQGFILVNPVALFYVNKAGRLMPIAIQLEFFEGEIDHETPIFFPSDPFWMWQYAKMWFNSADSAYHYAITKIMQTNCLCEGLALAVHRNLSVSHPLYQLVAPHIRYIFHVNHVSMHFLYDGCHGWIDKSCTIGRIGVFSAIRGHYLDYNLERDGFLPNDLKNRGVDDPNKLPHYHFRDDGMLLWAAIHNYVSTICEIFYKDEEAVRMDYELQSWAQDLCECASEQSVRVKGVPLDSKVLRLETIADIFTYIIFTSSARFAAVHYGFYEQYAYWPNYPTRIQGEPPRSKKKEYTPDMLLEMVLDPGRLINTLLISKVLSERQVNALGEIEIDHFHHPLAKQALEKFKQDLRHIDKHIEQQNARRLIPYTHLLPKNLPNCMYG